MKICKDCKKEFSLNDFPKTGTTCAGKIAYRANCKKCFALEKRMLYRMNPKYRAAQLRFSRLQYENMMQQRNG